MLVSIGLILLSSTISLSHSCCEKRERVSSLLDAAVDLISKAKTENISCPEEIDSIRERVLDCADLYKRCHSKNDVYAVSPINRLTTMKSIVVYCDMVTEGGGWTVIQRRGDFGRDNDYFDKDWDSYRKGFGNPDRDFWLGNDNIFALTNQRLYSVRFDLEDSSRNKFHARYDKFWIDDELNKYALHLSEYSGTAGDSMQKHNNMKFSTKDNDEWSNGNCAAKYRSGWWFYNCLSSNLNGMYNNQSDGILWYIKNNHVYMPHTEIKIRPFLF